MSEGSDEPRGDERVVGVGAELARGAFDHAGREDGAVAGVSGSLWGVFLRCGLFGVGGEIAFSTLYF